MGDVLHALAAVAALREARPGWEIGWAIEPHWAELLEGAGCGSGRGPVRPVVDRVHRVQTRAWKTRPMAARTAWEVLALRREMRGAGYDVCVDVQGSVRSAVIGRMAGAGRMVGMERPREAPAAWMYGERVELRSEHVVEQACELVGAAAGVALRPGRVALPVDRAAEAWTDELLGGWGRGGGWVLLAPTAGWGAKVWPAERYKGVVAALGRAGYRCVVNAATAHDQAAQAVVEGSGGTALMAGGGVAELVALTRRMDLVIAGDTGPMHLAAALRVPVVGLFGPTDPARNGPYGTRSAVLRHGSSVRDHRRWHETEAGLMRISVEAVVEAALGMLDGGIGEAKTAGKDRTAVEAGKAEWQ